MEYTLKKTHPCECEIAVKINKDLIRHAKDEYFEEIAEDVSIPGFRKGKVPREVLEKQFSEKAQESIIRKLISVAMRKISDAESFKIITYPQVKDLKFSDSELQFKINVELEPEINISNYKGIKAKRIPFEIQDSEINEVIEKVRESFANFLPVQREARMNDYLIADYTMEVEGAPKDERKDEWIFLHEHSMLGDFTQKLVGVKSGDEKAFDVTLPENHPNKDMRGKKASFNVKVKDVKEKNLPEINDELAKLAGDYKDLEALKQAIHEDIKRRKEQDQEAKIEREILDYLVQNNVFNTSRGVIERHLEKLVHDAVERLIQRGYSKEEAQKQHDTLKKEFQEEAEKQVRLAFILEHIAKQEDIKVKEEDLLERFNQLAQQYHVPAEKVREHFQKEENLDSLIEQIINEKVFKLIKENAEII